MAKSCVYMVHTHAEPSIYCCNNRIVAICDVSTRLQLTLVMTDATSDWQMVRCTDQMGAE